MYRSRGSWVSGSQLTTANGISTCSGAASTGGGSGGALETTIFSSGFALVAMCSVGPQMHCVPHLVECLSRGLAGLVGALGHDSPHELGIFLEFLGAAAHSSNFLHHFVDDFLLAIEAADTRRATAFVHPAPGGLIGIDFVQVPHRALLRIARIGTPYARRVSDHCPHFLYDAVRILAQSDRVAVGLGFFVFVVHRDLRRRCQFFFLFWLFCF